MRLHRRLMTTSRYALGRICHPRVSFRGAAWVVGTLYLSTMAAGVVAAADQPVQIPVQQLLNGRAVSTLTGGAVVPWTDGVDQSDGLVTTAVMMSLHQNGMALPDDGVFASDSRHPQVVLNFSNAAPATSKQIFYLHGAGAFEFAVPSGHYSRLFLFLLSSIGPSPLTVTMTYADGTTTAQTFTLPDWGTGMPLPTNPPIFFNLIAGMHKWNKQDQMIDTPSHTITGVELSPNSLQPMTKVAIAKPNAAQYLIFWGATGLASDVSSTMDGGAASDVPIDDGGAQGGADAGVDAEAGVDSKAGDDGGTPLTGAPDATTPPVVIDAFVDRTQAPGVVAPTATGGCSLASRPSGGAPGENRGGLFLIAAAAMSARRRRDHR
jgi:hypothetical protein